MFGRGILHVWGGEVGAYRIFVKKPEEKRPLGKNLGIDGSVTLKESSRNRMGLGAWTGLSWLGTGRSGGLL